MQIDYALILSAGLGTRMGEIGKKIPKVLWPVYFKTLLELQIRYCEDLGIKKIYINTHFLHEEIESFLKEKNLLGKVTILYEDPLLDSGGAIHNLAAQKEVGYKGNLLLLNGDQFIFFDHQNWTQSLKRIKTCRAVLFGIRVSKNSAYNETVLKDNCLVEIKKNTEMKNDFITYSGLGILNMNGLAPVPGISKFWETVANYKKEKVEFITPEHFEYWDFGTADIYAENIFNLSKISERKSAMGKFLEKHLAFKGDENLFLDINDSAIDLDYTAKFSSHSISAKGLVQKI